MVEKRYSGIEKCEQNVSKNANRGLKWEATAKNFKKVPHWQQKKGSKNVKKCTFFEVHVKKRSSKWTPFRSDFWVFLTNHV